MPKICFLSFQLSVFMIYLVFLASAAAAAAVFAEAIFFLNFFQLLSPLPVLLLS